MTLRPLQTWFDKMTTRERSILLIAAWAVVIIWSLMLMNQAKKLNLDVQQKKAVLKTQADTLAKKPTVEKQIADYKETFKTSVSAAELVAKVTNYYKQEGMQAPTISQNREDTKKDAIFSVNSVTVHYSRTTLRPLMAFMADVLRDSPHLIVDEFQNTPERANQELNDGTITVKALQLVPGALDVGASPPSTTGSK